MSAEEALPEYQIGDVVAVRVPIEHSANLTAVRASFVFTKAPGDVRLDAEARLSAVEEGGPGRTIATFVLRIGTQEEGECHMTMLVADYASGRTDVPVEDAPVFGFKVVPEKDDHPRADGFFVSRMNPHYRPDPTDNRSANFREA